MHSKCKAEGHAGKAIFLMKICVVTPYYKEDIEWLRQAHASVKAQTIPAWHILVCDGSAPAQIPDFQGTHIVLQRSYRDYGNTPRLIGCYNAITQDADAIAFLDADNWYYPGHLQSLIEIAMTERLDAVASARMLHRLDGSPMIKCPTVDGRNYIDTSCLVVLRPAFRHLIAWVLQGQDTAAETDQYLWRMMRSAGARLAFVDRPTVAYRTRHQVHYDQAAEPAPPGAIRRTDLHGDRYQ
jgi:glycosyltransferase involved in cell wall biosynthesis